MVETSDIQAPRATCDEALLAQVLDSFSKVEDARLRQVLQSAIRHLHEFVYEIKPSHEEWRRTLDYLAAVGQACTDKRQEFVLMSDLLGVSTAVDRAGYGAQEGDTPSSVEGPFYVEGSPDIEVGGSIVLDDMPDGEATVMRGIITDGDGNPVADAIVDVWQTAPNRLYAVTDEDQSDLNLRGRIHADSSGYYEFHTIKPVPYSVPTNGPCGAIVRAAGGHGMRAAHIHMRVEAPGYKTLVTQVFPEGDPYLESDTVFGASPALVAAFKPTQHSDGPTLSVDFNIVLMTA